MKSILKVTSTLAVVFALTFATVNHATAQSPTITTGVVTSVATADDGSLTGFSIVSGDGTFTEFTVSASNPNTSFGLVNRVGERWVSDFATDAREAASRLQDQQKRQTQVSVQAGNDNVAISVVQAQSTDIDANLGYLFAVVAIALVAVIGYVAYMGVRQRTISEDIDRLRDEDRE